LAHETGFSANRSMGHAGIFAIIAVINGLDITLNRPSLSRSTLKQLRS
jgi:hypothetical protein